MAEWAAPSTAPGMLDPDGVHPVIGSGTTAWANIVARDLPRTGPAATGGYAMPVDQHWCDEHPSWFTKPHHDGRPAIDIPIPEGTSVYAAAAGTVTSSPTGGNCGEGLVIAGDDGNRYTYCHVIRPLVPVGVHVQAADPIMISGNTGRPDGAHLHFEIAGRTGQAAAPNELSTVGPTAEPSPSTPFTPRRAGEDDDARRMRFQDTRVSGVLVVSFLNDSVPSRAHRLQRGLQGYTRGPLR